MTTGSPADKPPSGVAARAARVLYIEPDADNVQLARTLLASLNGAIEVAGVGGGGAGLDEAVSWRPDLILLDLGLPDMDGRDVLRALRADERTRAIPVIVMSANAEARDSDEMRAARLAGYLVKPIDIAEFLALAGATLGRPRT